MLLFKEWMQRVALRAVLLAAGALGVLAAPAGAVTIWAVNGSNQLVTMDSVTPSSGQTSTPITGLQPGENIVSLDARPAGGGLYGVGLTGAEGRLYRIDPATGAATMVGTGPFSGGTGSTVAGFDFNPVVDRARLVNTADQNLRLVPDTATQIIDTPLNYAVGDVNNSVDPTVVAVAYTNGFQGATTTTIYGYDEAPNPDVLVTMTNPNSGALHTVGSAGATINATGVGGFDIQPGTNAAFVALSRPGVVGGQWLLYDLNLTTGIISGGRTIGATAIRGITVAPTAKFVLEAPSSVTEGAAPATVTLRRTGSTAGTASVRFATGGGSATAGSDYTATDTTVDFADGQETAPVSIPIVADGQAEPAETIDMALSNPTGGAFVGLPFKATLTVNDNTPAATPTGETPATGSTPTVPTGPGGLQAPDTIKPVLSISFRRTVRLSTLLRSGLRISIRPSETVNLGADLKLGKTRLARVSRRLGATSTKLVLRLGKKAKARLRRSRARSLTLTVTATDLAGNKSAAVTRRLRLSRR